MSHCTLDAYRELLATARSHGWRSGAFTAPAGPRTLLLRHDVDYSVELARQFAEVNAAAGARGTFFLQLRSDLYNLLAPRNLAAARALVEAGQVVGLHFPVPDTLPGAAAEVVEAVLQEQRRLCEVLPAAPVFSWHNPTPAWLEKYGGVEVPGLINAYAPRFTAQMLYRSDSNLRHPPAVFATLLEEEPGPLHLLFHPVNWVIGGTDMTAVLAGAWAALLREREHEFRTNNTYRACFPQGMPEELIASFARRWEALARGKEGDQPEALSWMRQASS